MLWAGFVKPTIYLMDSVEMPKYKCHKEVWALKIKSIVRDGEGENRESDGSAIITPEEEGYAPCRVEGDYFKAQDISSCLKGHGNICINLPIDLS